MSIDSAILKNFVLVGKDLSNRRLNSSHAGNISIRLDANLIITRSGSMLGWLEPEDIVFTDLKTGDSEKERLVIT